MNYKMLNCMLYLDAQFPIFHPKNLEVNAFVAPEKGICDGKIKSRILESHCILVST